MSESYLRAARARAADAAPRASSNGPAGLSKQDVVNMLDSVPTFNLVDASTNRIMGVPDESGQECIRWWIDPDEAGSALVLAQHLNPSLNLRLTLTPLGTAFAFAEGWQSTPAKVPLRLHASKSVVAGVAEELGASADDDVVPVFCCDDLCSARALPFFLSRQDLAETWQAAGRPAAALPAELTVVSLRSLVAKMRAGHGGVDWKTAMFIGGAKAFQMAQKIQSQEEANPALLDPEAEPPPLA